MEFENKMNETRNECVIRLKYETYPLDYGYYICGPVLAALIIIGFFGNFVCLVIQCKTRPMPVVSFYTIPLCVCDCAVLAGSFFMNSLPNLLYGRMLTYGPYVRVYPFVNFFSNFAYTSCVWLVIVLSIERYFALCHPWKHKIYDARRRSILISILCLIAAIVYNVPLYFEINTFECFELTARKVIPLMEPAPFRSWQSYWIVYKLVLRSILFSFGPFLFLCYLSLRMLQEVKRTRRLALRMRRESENNSRRRLHYGSLEAAHEIACQNTSPIKIFRFRRRNGNGRSSGSNSSDKQRNVLSYTLLCIVLKFLICHTPPAIIDLCEIIMAEEQFRQPLVEHLVDTSTMLVVANSSLNIFVYAWCSGAFRTRVKSLLASNSNSTVRVLFAAFRPINEGVVNV